MSVCRWRQPGMISLPTASASNRSGIGTDHIKVIDDTFTAQAFITTDLDDNQITAFHPGAMQYAHLNKVADAGPVALGIVAPDGRQAMIEHAAQFAAAKSPSFSTRGRGCRCSATRSCAPLSTRRRWITVNDYEWGLLQQKTGLTAAQVAAQVRR